MADGRVLLMKRAEGVVNGGTWAFPAGKIEDGEMPDAAALREFTEETGHIIDAPRIQISEQAGFRLYGVEGKEFVPVLCDEHTEFQWADPAALPEGLHPGVYESIAQNAIVSAHAMDSARLHDHNDFMTVQNNPISRAGVFQYMGSDIPNADDKKRIYNVFLPPEELSHPDFLRSIEVLPLIEEHVMLGSGQKGFTPPEAKGVEGAISNPRFDGGVLSADIKIFSQRLKDVVQRGKNNLSLGYRCVYQKASGVFNGQHYDFIQRQLRGNHLAVVGSSRRNVAVLDQAIAFDSFDIKLEQGDSIMADDNQTTGAGEEGDKKEMSLSEVTAFIADVAPKLAKINETLEKLTAVKPTTEEAATVLDESEEGDDKKDEKKGEAMDNAITQESILTAIADRDSLAKDLSVHVGVFDHSGMTADKVAVYGLEKLGLTAAKGQERAVLSGFLAGAKRTTTVGAPGFGLDNNTTKSAQAGGVVGNYISNKK